MNPIEFFFDNINDTAKWIFTQQPIIIVLFLVFMAILLIFYATKTVSKQNSEDHEEKKMLLTLFADLKNAISAMSSAQEKRNESIEVQIQEQRNTNKNLSSLNVAFADYHSSLADTIGMIFKNQVTGRLDKVESKVDEIYSVVSNKPDCNDEILNRLNDLGREFTELKTLIADKKEG